MKPSIVIFAAVASAFLLSAPAARAEEPGATPAPAPAAPVPAPAPTQPDAKIPTPARREDEPETTPAPAAADSGAATPSLMAQLFSASARQKVAGLGTELETLRAELTRANASLAAAQEQITALTAENARLADLETRFSAELPAIEAALQSGDSAAAALQTGFGQRIASLVATGVTASVTRAGHNPAKLPGPGAAEPDTGKPETKAGGTASGYAMHWREKGWAIPGLS